MFTEERPAAAPDTAAVTRNGHIRRQTKKRLATTMDAGRATVQSANWGGMTSAYMQMGEGADFTPLLEGLLNDLCQAPIGTTC